MYGGVYCIYINFLLWKKCSPLHSKCKVYSLSKYNLKHPCLAAAAIASKVHVEECCVFLLIAFYGRNALLRIGLFVSYEFDILMHLHCMDLWKCSTL